MQGRDHDLGRHTYVLAWWARMAKIEDLIDEIT